MTTEAGDEDLEAAGVEEVVIAPEVQEDVLGGDDFALVLEKALEKNGFRLEETKTGAVAKGGKALDVRLYRLDF